MASTRSLFALALGAFAAQGTNAATYCYCEGSAAFTFLGMEVPCKELGSNWSPSNCDLGSSDVCKYGGEDEIRDDATKSLDEWCASNDRQGIDLTGEPLQGGTLICVDSKPDWVDDSCEALGTDGHDEDLEGPPIDLDAPAEEPVEGDVATSRLLRRAGEGSGDFLRYVPEDQTANLVKTEATPKVKRHADKSKETIYDIKELRLKGYNWQILRSYNNSGGDRDFTESVEITKGFETTSGSNTKASVDVNFGYNGIAAHFGISASVSHEFFANKKDTTVTRTNDTFFVAKGSAAFLYQKVYLWESKVTFRLKSEGGEFDNDGKAGKRGTFTLAISEEEPLEGVYEFEILSNQKLLTAAPLKGEGTFTVKDEFALKEPKFKPSPILEEPDWTGHVRDEIRKIGFQV
ncbi:hypothetical protein ACHAQA_003770 [Verticillium albo-atrum]